MEKLTTLALFILLSACTSTNANTSPAKLRNPSSLSGPQMCVELKEMEIHAHRGAWDRPENMITAFLRAADQGADYVEMDLQISKDDQIIVAHDAFMKKECRDASGQPVGDKFYRKMTLPEIKSYNCGSVVSRGSPVPGEKISTLDEVLAALKDKKNSADREIKLNIEIKYNPTQPQYYPPREEYVKKILEVLDKSEINPQRIMFQSFDIDTLRVLRGLRTDLRLSPLLSDVRDGVKIARELKAELVTPHFSQVNNEMLTEFHQTTETHPHGIKVVPWTVSDPDTALKLMEMGVDGLITDSTEWFTFARSLCQ